MTIQGKIVSHMPALKASIDQTIQTLGLPHTTEKISEIPS